MLLLLIVNFAYEYLVYEIVQDIGTSQKIRISNKHLIYVIGLGQIVQFFIVFALVNQN